MNSALELYSTSDHLPRILFDKKTGFSYDVAETAFQAAVGTHKPRWEWFEEKITVQDLKKGHCGTDGRSSGYPGPFGSELDKAGEGRDGSELVPRPELAIFNLAMVGGGKVFGKAHIYGMCHISGGEFSMDNNLSRLSLGVIGFCSRG